jgi:periplasmic protein TonB
MTDHTKKHKRSPYQNWLVPGVIGLVFLAAIGFLVKVFLSPEGPRNKEKISTVTLLKPPPEVKEKPPEPEIQKEAPKETIVTPVDSPQPQNSPDQSQDNAPAGSDLGVDGEGGAGSDSFGLVGKKGGRNITLGGGGGGGLSRMSLLTKYGWYTRKVEKELWQQVKIILDRDGGIPKGKHQATIHLVLNANGKIIRSRLVETSGDAKIDKAVKSALLSMKVSEPLPDGMPSSMTIRISSQG